MFDSGLHLIQASLMNSDEFLLREVEAGIGELDPPPAVVTSSHTPALHRARGPLDIRKMFCVFRSLWRTFRRRPPRSLRTQLPNENKAPVPVRLQFDH